MFFQKSTMQKTTKILHERDSRAKKHRTQHLSYSRIGVLIGHCSGELDDPSGSRWCSNGGTTGVLDLYRRTILSNGLIHVMQTVNWKEIVNVNLWIQNQPWFCVKGMSTVLWNVSKSLRVDPLRDDACPVIPFVRDKTVISLLRTYQQPIFPAFCVRGWLVDRPLDDCCSSLYKSRHQHIMKPTADPAAKTVYDQSMFSTVKKEKH